MNEMKKKFCPLLCMAKPAEQRVRCLGKSCAFCMDYGFGQETCTISGQSIYMPAENVLKATVYIPIDDFNNWNEHLAEEKPDLAQFLIDKRNIVIEWFAVFNNDYSATIRIQLDPNSHKLYANAFLYKSGVPMPVKIDGRSNILQDAYVFTHDGKTFDLQIEKCPF